MDEEIAGLAGYALEAIRMRDEEIKRLRTELHEARELLPKAFLAGIAYVGVTGNPPPSEYFAEWLVEQ